MTEGKKDIYPIEEDNPFFIRNNNLCIGCGKCVKVSQEQQCCNILKFKDKNLPRKPPSYDIELKDTDCVYCGNCVSVCPTEALQEKWLTRDVKARKKSGEITTVTTTCPFCGVGCNYDLNVENNRLIGVTTHKKSPVNDELLCVKGHFGTDYVHSPKRLTSPLVRINGELVPVSWDEALDYAADKLKAIIEEDGPDAFAALSSARCTNEENYLMQKFVRAGIGTNNIDHCART